MSDSVCCLVGLSVSKITQNVTAEFHEFFSFV